MPGGWWQVSIVVPRRAGDIVADLMHKALGQPPVQSAQPGRAMTTVTAYVPGRSRLAHAFVASFRHQLSTLSQMQFGQCLENIQVTPLPRTNWATSWKAHFHPLEFGDVLLVKPTWSRRKPKPGQKLVILDPGLSFGTGHHPTTSYCLRELVARRGTSKPRSFLDVGTGTGILAIAAAKLGYKPVRAIDVDQSAVRCALVNARRNRVHHVIKLEVLDIAQFSSPDQLRYDVVCANLHDHLLLTEAPRLAGLVAPTGFLVLAGLLRKKYGRVRRAYEDLGLRMLCSKTEREWRSGTFTFPSRCQPNGRPSDCRSF